MIHKCMQDLKEQYGYELKHITLTAAEREDMPFKCVQCDFASDNKHALNSHVRIHDADARRSNNSDVAPLAATIVNNYDEEDNTSPVTQTSDTTSHHNRNHD